MCSGIRTDPEGWGVWVIDGGRIVEQGTHHELLAAGGHYFNLYTQQFQREEEDRILAKEEAENTEAKAC